MALFSVSVTALAGYIATTASAFNTVHSNYRNADKDSRHIQLQKEHLQLNQAMLNDLIPNTSNTLHGLKSSLADIETALPTRPCAGKKRDKLRWAAYGGKRKAQEEIGRLKEIETSTAVTLLLTTNDKLRELIEIYKAQNEHFSERDQKLSRHESRLGLLESYMGEYELRARFRRSPAHLDQQLVARIHYCNWMLSLGITLRLIVSSDNCRTIYGLMFRWPLFYSLVLVWRVRIMRGWPMALYISLRPKREIPSDSAIIKACLENDVKCIQRLFSESLAHVTDVTSNNLTLLRFAIRGGHLEVVKLLLDNGADPNQTFGKFETSPLNNAFLTGRADMIRLLFTAKADLDHVNHRTWTSLHYLWDPDIPNHSTTSEILDICTTHQFDRWNSKDRAGWAPIHRVAAYGKADHIKKLFNMGVVDRHAVPLTVAGWSPLQCAVRFGNLSTFKYLVEETRTFVNSLVEMQDKRGWTLLHLAAASGSQELITFLLSTGLDPTALSDRATLLLPEELDDKALTPRTIAEHYGFIQEYDSALQVTGYLDAVSIDQTTGKKAPEAPEQVTDNLSKPRCPYSMMAATDFCKAS
ncbi:ankyrin repeat-containing domain protein [Hyaloscypha finlandica]|nr:ankyrin repeat-containing domain protein [Hyaloscypha finlandica]